MSLFQKSVEKKYLNELDSALINIKYKEFQAYFGNSDIQENIRNAKEEQFQEGFLRELFVAILGYTLNPQPNFNLTTELKNIANSKKVDGAILKGDDAIAVIELKGTDTTDIDKIEAQAFGYKNHHPKCVYVITSNFEKLRFYIQNAVDHIDFDLFNLSREQFSLLWLCLAKDNLLTGIPLRIKESSVLQEENITKKLYADYSKFRESIYGNLVKNNPDTDKLLLFKKTQKLLDRFLFIFFAEDRLLLPPNSISEIVKQWTTLKEELDEYVPLYDRFKKYFGYMNTGHKGTKYEVYAYNGGLFAPDDILDNITIDDDILREHTLRLSSYDFETDIDVNILGHIFEHSLGEIENVQAEINGEPVDSQKTKRKKDGIFYTPKYITKYIVENTVGRLCTEKRMALNIVDEEYAKGRKNRKKDTVKALDDKLTAYRTWLLSLTILDPACGSGAFLNQALDFLITEHRKVDELRAQLFGAGLVLSDITTDILEKNIYGVDLNEESVEIAKLSLWLHTAQKGRKLNRLNNNIKCGNSLIDDPAVAGDKAFSWQKEFPSVFQKKEKKIWHITTATHNSRYSQRMFENHVALGEAEWFDTEDAIVIADSVKNIVLEDKLNVLEYNICGDHMHILLVCEEEELPKIVGKIKSVSAKIRNRKRGYTTVGSDRASNTTRGRAPLSIVDDDTPKRGETQRQVWTQKFGKTEVKGEEYLANAMAYIRNNRVKHKLPKIKEVEKLKEEFLCTPQHALRTEYKGGFDVVIGNPPYVTRNMTDQLKQALRLKYRTAQYQIELYTTFIEQGTNILKNNSFMSFIVPNSWLKNMMMSECRKFVLENINIIELIPKLERVFTGASVDTMIFLFNKQKANSKTTIKENVDQIITFKHNVEQKRFYTNEGYIFDVEVRGDIIPIIHKMTLSVATIGSIFDVTRGINPYDKYTGQTDEIIKTRAYHSNYKKDTTFVPELKGLHITRYYYNWDKKHYISYGSWLAAPRQVKYFKGDRIIFREILGKTLVSTLITEEFKIDRSLYIARLENEFEGEFDIKYVLGILNSNLLAFYFRYTSNEFDNLFPKIRVAEFKKLPIKKIPINEQVSVSSKVSMIINLTKQFYDTQMYFIYLLQSKFELTQITRKIDNWYDLEAKEFLKELKNAKVQLSLSEESEWMQYFNEEKEKAQKLKAEIEKTDKEIDQLVYELYGLTAEEIKIVESSTV